MFKNNKCWYVLANLNGTQDVGVFVSAVVKLVV